MNSDSLQPFDRTKVRGRVSSVVSSDSASTRPSSRASNNSMNSQQEGEGRKLGGSKTKDDSNLLSR